MSVIQPEDLTISIARALQFISYHHPPDFIAAMADAYRREENPAARDAIGQILLNSRIAAETKRPICQDTGMVTVFVEIGMDCRFAGGISLQEMVDEGVRRAYLDSGNPLRLSMVVPPVGERKNTGDNSPAIVHCQLVAGDGLSVMVAAKGGGSENKSKFTVLNPSGSLISWVCQMLPQMGAGWCPPGVIGLGLGGSAEQAMLLAKKSLMDPIDMPELRRRGPRGRIEALRLELYEAINALGIGAQGLGGVTTVLDVKIFEFPTHAASLPVAMIPNCAASRHCHFHLNGTSAASFTPPEISWPEINSEKGGGKRVFLDGISHDEIASWRAGETLLLNGSILTGRDAAHQRLTGLAAMGQPLPVDFHGRFIYYVGPVPPIAGEVVGPAGPTTATRMDKYSRLMLEDFGLFGMIGKAERGPETIGLIEKNRAVYLAATGGAACLVAQAITAARLVAFADLGMEAIYEFTVRDMPVTVAVDSLGHSIHQSGPARWRRDG
ncbi:MAG: fumarate hydratase [Desulfobulbaceae bacterium]|jgi:fumarate hydratase class I|nr:fumarate hydratase [Desulfobulbaceae bacterium]